MNAFKTAFGMLVLTALLLLAGAMTLGEVGIIIAAVIALGVNFFSYWNCNKMDLRIRRLRNVRAGW